MSFSRLKETDYLPHVVMISEGFLIFFLGAVVMVTTLATLL